MKNQLNIFLSAVMFYTRIPVPKIKNYQSHMLSQSTRYLPLIGLIVGGLNAGVYYGLSFILPYQIALLLSIAFTIYLTGAFHEDGFADFCDGFGGGYTKEKVLTIMKDSRIGTYGSLALILILGTKFYSLTFVQPNNIALMLIAGHTLSRIFPVILIYVAQYVRNDESSKSKAIGLKTSIWGLIIACIFGLVPIIWVKVEITLLYFMVIVPIFLVFRHYIIKKIGGYTGDVLGALQQISEVTFYLCILVLNQAQTWNCF